MQSKKKIMSLQIRKNVCKEVVHRGMSVEPSIQLDLRKGPSTGKNYIQAFNWDPEDQQVTL